MRMGGRLYTARLTRTQGSSGTSGSWESATPTITHLGVMVDAPSQLKRHHDESSVDEGCMASETSSHADLVHRTRASHPEQGMAITELASSVVEGCGERG
jgi:hypothetical protein